MPYREESESPPRKELERSPSPVIENDRSTPAGPSKKPRFMTTGSSAMDNQRRQVCSSTTESALEHAQKSKEASSHR